MTRRSCSGVRSRGGNKLGLLYGVVLLSCARVVSAASGDRGFQWKFDGNMVQTTLVACQSYKLIVQPFPLNATTNGTAPYYMISFPVGGIPTTTLIGTDPANLAWTVDQPAGTNMLLTIADSANLGGGQSPSMFSVSAGSTDACIPPPPPPSSNFTIVTNTTNPVETCAQVGFRVFGGQKPYNLSIAAVGSPVVTNVTMGPTDDVFTFINRADPNGEFLAAISDATGTWGTSTQMITTTGSSNVDCIGLISTSGNSSFVDQHPPPPSKSKTPIIVLAVIIPIVVILLALAVGVWFYRKKREERLREPEPAFLPEAWSAPVTASSMAMSEGGSGSIGGLPMSAHPDSKQRYFAVPQIHMSGSRSGSQSQIGMLGPSSTSPRSASSYDNSGSSSSYASPAGGSGSGNPGYGHGRANSTAKGRRMYGNARNGGDIEPGPVGPNGVRLPPGLPSGWEVEPQILIQHRDAGAVNVGVQPAVQEIPPPYIDRTADGDAGVGAGASTGSGSGANANRESESRDVDGETTVLPPRLPPPPPSPQPHQPQTQSQPQTRPPTSPHPLPPIPNAPISPHSPHSPQYHPQSPTYSSQLSHSHPYAAPLQAQPYSQTNRYAAPLPNLPGPLPPPPAPTGLPASPAPLRAAQGAHSPQPSLGQVSTQSQSQTRDRGLNQNQS